MKDQSEILERSLKAALEASQKARELLLSYFGKLKNIEEKAHAGLVSEADKKSEGPSVVKVTKARKLVAAGTAEDVEIQAELENPEENKEEAE